MNGPGLIAPVAGLALACAGFRASPVRLIGQDLRNCSDHDHACIRAQCAVENPTTPEATALIGLVVPIHGDARTVTVQP